jgi:parvulin-like peptidyl-prolyl isomerase
MKKMLRILIAAAIALGLAVLPAFAAPDTVLASHNGNNYFLEDFNIFFMKQVGAKGLIAFLEQALVYEEAKKLKLAPTPEEKQKFISDTMTTDIYKGFQQLYTQAAVDRFVEYTIMNQKYRKYLEDKFVAEKKINITDDDAHQFYNQNIGLFQPGERVWMSIISVDSLETANEVLKKLDGGADFNELAGIHNVDPELKSRNGYVGMMEKGKGLPAPIEEAVFALAAGKYSQVIKGTMFHIVFVHDKKPAENHPYDEVAADIKQMLKDDLVQQYIDEYLNTLYSTELDKFDIKADLFKAEDTTKPAAAGAEKPK